MQNRDPSVDRGSEAGAVGTTGNNTKFKEAPREERTVSRGEKHHDGSGKPFDLGSWVVLTTFFIALTKYMMKSTYRKKECILAPTLRVGPLWGWKHEGRGLRQLLLPCSVGKHERGGAGTRPIHSGTGAHGWPPPTFQVDFSSSPTCPEALLGDSSPLKLITEMNYHRSKPG